MNFATRSAICQVCDWRATGTSAWDAADGHEAGTGHDVRRVGTGAAAARPAPFTQPLEDPEQQ